MTPERQNAESVRGEYVSLAAVLDMFAPPGDDACVLRWVFDE